MSDDPKPDPYLALGLTKDATSQQIKATYRKLALKFHPDKVNDESLKAAAADNFHKIQTAYETLGDDSKRAKYDANARLEELQKAFQKEKEQSSRYRPAAPQPQPVRPDVRPSSYDVPLQATRGSTYPQPRASEQYRTFRPQGYDSEYFDDTPASRPTSRKHSYFEAEPPKKSSKSDPEKKKHSSREAEKERSSRHDKSKRSEKDRKRDRETKKTYVVPDETESEPDLKPRRYDSARETSKEYVRKKESSESEDSADDVARKSERLRSYAATYMRRPDPKVEDKPRIASLRTGWEHLRGASHDQPRRSSARSPIREQPLRDRARQYSDPTILRTDMFTSRPPLEKHNTAPPEKFPIDRERERERDRDHERDRDRRAKTMSSARAAYPDHPSLKRAETDPSANARRPDLSRGESRLRYEVNHGMPTPPISPPREGRDPYSFKSASRRYVIDEDDHTREISPGTKPTRRARSPSPDRERERKSRTSSSRKTRPEAPEAPPVLPRLRTGIDLTYGGDHLYDSPRSARPMATAPDYFAKQKEEPTLPYEIPKSSRRYSPREDAGADADFLVHDMSPNKERKSSKSSRPKHSHRSYTHAYGSGFGRGVFA
ncbi:DnaJ domain-containing protein 11 [Elsinoe fawcettii]|nr:DnaJ domain-containing protein 11 [Elsinoe fawcettii]